MTNFTTWRSLIDGEEIAVIPDTGLLHNYDAMDIEADESDNVLTWPDSEGSNDASGTGTYTESGINGLPAVELDGESDEYVANGVGGENYTFAGVWKVVEIDGNERFVSNGTSDGYVVDNGNPEDYRLRHRDINESSAAEGTIQTQPQIIVASYDGSQAIVELNNQTIISESNWDFVESTGDLFLGSQDDSLFANIFAGQFLFYNVFYDGSGREDIYNALASKWDF